MEVLIQYDDGNGWESWALMEGKIDYLISSAQSLLMSMLETDKKAKVRIKLHNGKTILIKKSKIITT